MSARKKSPKSAPFIVRDAIPSDISFIYSTMLNSLKHDSEVGRSVSTTVFYENYRAVIDSILSGPKTHVLVACPNSDHNTILGYCIQEGETILHFVYVKESFRNFGIATQLVAEALAESMGVEIFITHKTKVIDKVLRVEPDFVYNPFILYLKEEDE